MNNLIPAESELHAASDQYGYTDSFSISLRRSDLTTSELIPAFFQSAPRWVDGLFVLRNKIVMGLGLKTGGEHSRNIQPPYEMGRQIGLFRIIGLNDQEVVFGADDRHLDFRTSLLLTPRPNGSELVVSTAVKINNNAGAVYFAVVKPFHRLIVPAMAKAMARRLEAIPSAT